MDVSGYDWKKLLLGLRRVFAAGPAGCVDWTMFMRGAAALAYLSLQHIEIGFDWMKEQIRKTHPSNFFLTITQSVLNRPKIPCAFNDLRSVLYDKA